MYTRICNTCTAQIWFKTRKQRKILFPDLSNYFSFEKKGFDMYMGWNNKLVLWHTVAKNSEMSQCAKEMVPAYYCMALRTYCATFQLCITRSIHAHTQATWSLRATCVFMCIGCIAMCAMRIIWVSHSCFQCFDFIIIWIAQYLNWTFR